MGNESLLRLGIVLSWLLVPAVETSFAEVNLSLEPASVSVSPGASVSLQLWARSDSAQSFDGADVVLQWDAAVLRLDENSDDDAPYVWNVSAFLSQNPRNDTWDDGDAIYTCLRPLSTVPPETDLLITTFRFTAAQNPGSTTASIPMDEETNVAYGGIVILGTTTGATITVASGDDGGGGGEPPDDDPEPPEDGEEQPPDDDDEGEADDDAAPPPDNDGNTEPGDEEVIIAPSPGGAEPPQEGDDGQPLASDELEASASPAPFSLCGAGILETILMSFAGLCMFTVKMPRPAVSRIGSP